MSPSSRFARREFALGVIKADRFKTATSKNGNLNGNSERISCSLLQGASIFATVVTSGQHVELSGLNAERAGQYLGDTMSEEVNYFQEKLSNLNRKWAVLGGCCLLVVFVGLGYLAVHRPVILDGDRVGIYVKNTGSIDALIHKVNGFWYWAGQVALLANMPGIHQRVKAGSGPVKLQIPDIPLPGKQILDQRACYMKLAVRYRIPGVPIFRYTTPLYFVYDPSQKIWTSAKSIPPKYRALGKVPLGNIDEIELDFHLN
ncbi:MAG: hypothetical protein JSV60_00830 [Desulfobacterales bacterium]|nr:MAG: hypothetical protein JSV60_00830 [Desulfobacterales bacterium]